MSKAYIAIDLKSFYASVECVERGLNPLTAYLVVADESRTDKTICLAVTPALKYYGIPGRARLFEVKQKLKEVNAIRAREKKPKIEIIVAPPRMALYMEYSTRIYQIYLQYVAAEDMHIYSIDEVFLDVTSYLKTYQTTAYDLAMRMIHTVLKETGITATAGIGTNLYLAKIAMDIVAKHAKADAHGVRIGFLDEREYRKQLWSHRPITDFWRIGKGYAKKLQAHGMYTMGDVARCSIGKENEFHNEDLLYRLFGINAELLIDHAWGYEPTEISDIKAYVPSDHSISSGQVLQRPYRFQEARLIVQEMTDALSLDLVKKSLVTNQVILTVGYDIESLQREDIASQYQGAIVTDGYGRKVPKAAHGTKLLGGYTASTKSLWDAMLSLYDRIVNPLLLIRRITVVAGHVLPEHEVEKSSQVMRQLSFFDELFVESEEEKAVKEREKKLQETTLSIQKRYGKNALMKGTSLQEGATAMERNAQIGGHKA